MNLTPHQQAAVDADAARLLLLAGAGSGKTKVIAERTARLFRDGFHPAEVLLLTFTRKAAAEMRTRIETRLEGQRVRGLHCLTVTTFHSWAARLLREYADRVKLPSNFVIRDEKDHEDLVVFAGRELGKCPEPGQPKKAGQWTSAGRLWKEEDVRDRYHSLMREAGALSYDDLETTLLRLLQQEDVAAELRGRWLHVLVDEFQDTSEAQQEILDLLSPRNLFVVGDVAQSIYRFRGARVEGFVRLTQDPAWTVLTLPDNFRSHPDIVEAANRLAARMEVPGIRMVATREAQSTFDDRPDAGLATAAVLPASKAVEELQLSWGAVFEDMPVAWSDIAILAPTWKVLESLVPTLEAAGIPHHLARRAGEVWDSEEARWLVACLRCAVNPWDHLSLWSALSAFAIRCSLGRWAGVRALALRTGLPVLDVMGTSPAEEWEEAIPVFKAIVAARTGIDEGDFSMALTGAINALVLALDALGLGSRALALLQQVLPAVDEWRSGTPGATIVGFLDFYGCRAVDGDAIAEPEEDAVTLSTIHGAKGLEWPVVLLAGWEEGLLPHVRAEGDLTEGQRGQVEESRRLAYVAATRARDRAVFLADAMARASRFLSEALPGWGGQVQQQLLPVAELEDVPW